MILNVGLFSNPTGPLGLGGVESRRRYITTTTPILAATSSKLQYVQHSKMYNCTGKPVGNKCSARWNNDMPNAERHAAHPQAADSIRSRVRERAVTRVHPSMTMCSVLRLAEGVQRHSPRSSRSVAIAALASDRSLGTVVMYVVSDTVTMAMLSRLMHSWFERFRSRLQPLSSASTKGTTVALQTLYLNLSTFDYRV